MTVPNYDLTDTTQTLSISRVLYMTDNPVTDRLFIPVNAPPGGVDYGPPESDNTEAQRLQSLLMTGYNVAAGVPWGQAELGSNQTGVKDITLTRVSGDGSTGQAQIYAAAYTAQPSGLNVGTLTYTWVANGAGLSNDAGAAVPGQAAQRSFTPPGTGTITYSCTITSNQADVTGNIGYVAQEIE